MVEEPLLKLNPFFLGEDVHVAPRDFSRKKAMLIHDDLVLRLPSIVDYIREELMKDLVPLGIGPRADVDAAGEWLVANSRLVAPEVPKIASPFWTGDPVISVATMSACCWVGFLFGECLRASVPSTTWQLDVSHKKSISYHQTVLVATSCGDMFDGPRVTMNFVRGRLRRSKGKTLGQLFDIWAETLSGKSPM